MNIISTSFFLLPQFFLLFFIHNSLSTLVKRQSIPSENDENGAAGEESPVGFGATDPPPSSLNEPIAVIGLDQTEDGVSSGGKTVADVAYDASDDQPSSTQAPSTAVPPAETPPSVQPAATSNDDDSRLEALTTVAETSITTAEEASSPEERNVSRETVTAATEQSSTVTTTPSSARRTAVVPKKKDSAAKERKGHKTGQPPPTAPLDKASEGTAVTLPPQRNCNSELMRRLIIENMHSKPSVAKRQIQSKVAEEINGKIDVVCAKHAFSYIVNSELFCEAEHNGVICLCFKQQ